MQHTEELKEQPGTMTRADGAARELLVNNASDVSLQAVSSTGEEQSPAGQWLGTNTSTLNAIERLKTTIDEETEKLEVRAVVDFDSFSQRKNRGLLELTRAMRLMNGEGVDPRVMPQLTGLRASLVRNQVALQVHLDAVREVSAIIARSIQEVESDGTYSLIASRKSK
jgi:hypothetical protein